MARAISSGNYLHQSATLVLPGAGSVFIRVRPTWASGDSSAHFLWSYQSDDGTTQLHIQRYSDNNFYAGWNGTQVSRVTVADTGLISAGNWYNVLLTWDDVADEVKFYIDNSLIGTSTAAFTAHTTAAELSVGAGAGSELGIRPADADIAEFARWDRVLTAEERTTLQVTGCPLHMLRSLVRYYPLVGKNSPEVDLIAASDLALTGTPAAAAHPRIFLPYAQSDYFVSGATHYTLTADVGAFTLSGQAANLLYGRKLTSDVGTFALAGQTANLLYARKLAADVAAFTLAGQAAGLLKGKTLTADVGTFALAGQDVEFRTGYALTADTGVFTESGQAAALRTTKILSAAHGSFTLSGQDATLTAAGVVTIPSGRLFRVSRETRIFRVPPQ